MFGPSMCFEIQRMETVKQESPEQLVGTDGKFIITLIIPNHRKLESFVKFSDCQVLHNSTFSLSEFIVTRAD